MFEGTGTVRGLVVNVTRPALRYHGGKWKLAPWIVSHFPPHWVYVEPFGGGASVLLRKPRSYAEVYNDMDGEIVNLFRVLRDNGQELKLALELTPFSRDEFVDAYLPCDKPIERARRTVVKSFMGFGSAAVTQAAATKPGAGFKPVTGFRNNSHSSAPAHDWANYPGRLPFLIDRLQGVVIENRDAIALIPQMDSPETLWYLDPPYVHSTRGLKQRRTPQSYRFEYTDDDHERLANAFKAVDGAVVLSGYPSGLYADLYKGWQIVTIEAHADGARDRTECLWLNDRASVVTPSLFSESVRGGC